MPINKATKPSFNFKNAVKDLLEQIPVGMTTTADQLADALGDPKADRAVKRALKDKELESLAHMVTGKRTHEAKIFTHFSTEKPLEQLARYQKQLSEQVIGEDRLEENPLIAGIDIAYKGDTAYSACILMDEENRVLDSSIQKTRISFPYIPGYFYWREAPAIKAAAKTISRYDLLIVNGHGVAHPRGCGLASHLGIELDKPTLGVAKNLLIGELEENLKSVTSISYKGRVIGARIRPKGKAAIYISLGHKISLESSIEIVKTLMRKGGLPEPLRLAHKMANESRNNSE
jgi:deoxyribonuclease V